MVLLPHLADPGSPVEQAFGNAVRGDSSPVRFQPPKAFCIVKKNAGTVGLPDKPTRRIISHAYEQQKEQEQAEAFARTERVLRGPRHAPAREWQARRDAERVAQAASEERHLASIASRGQLPVYRPSADNTLASGSTSAASSSGGAAAAADAAGAVVHVTVGRRASGKASSGGGANATVLARALECHLQLGSLAPEDSAGSLSSLGGGTARNSAGGSSAAADDDDGEEEALTDDDGSDLDADGDEQQRQQRRQQRRAARQQQQQHSDAGGEQQRQRGDPQQQQQQQQRQQRQQQQPRSAKDVEALAKAAAAAEREATRDRLLREYPHGVPRKLLAELRAQGLELPSLSIGCPGAVIGADARIIRPM